MSIYLTNFLNLMVKHIVLVACTPETYPMYLKVVNINYVKSVENKLGKIPN